VKSTSIKEVITEKISGEWGSEASDSSGIAVIRTANFLNSGKIDFSKVIRRTIDSKKVSKKKLISGDIIIEKSGGSPTQPVGRVVLFNNPDGDIYLCNNFTSVLRPNRDVVFPEYLFYVLLENHKKGKTLRYQKLLKSIFLDMFGDPVRNEKGWNKPKLKQFGSISTGNTPPRKDASNFSDIQYIEWIKTGNISTDSVYIAQATEYLSESGVKKGRTVSSGALLVACIAGSVESIGRAALTNRTVAFNQQINAIQPNCEVNPFFLYVLFKLSKAYVQSHATKGMKKILTKGDFEKIKMINPPFDVQNQFATIAEKVESIKARYRISLAELESFYGALSQKAFKGELK